jgi:hypothetical protein
MQAFPRRIPSKLKEASMAPRLQDALDIINELDIDPEKVTAHEYGRLTANLQLCYNNAVPEDNLKQLWEQFIEHLCYPDYKDFPHGLFLSSQKQNTHYHLLLKAIEDLYDRLAGDDDE